ncbi:hypothetical protein Patl1_11825 [Pistacia atlantica]|uniref:Uncharacterized protein n=1 Tax=Pistacia atlantica TaxID=434234 RepID=A0ACC1A2F6_9ROSI|nr:hypothetical protein Patl1_11825 [Pistacia atlantica]
MESSEEEDDFPAIESITPQSKIDSVFQSHTEKGIRRVCCELLDLRDAVENLCGNVRTKYLAFLRISEEVVEMKHELRELRKHISGRLGNFGTSRALAKEEIDDHKMIFLDKFDVLLAEHKVEEALEVLDAEERNYPELKGSAEASSAEASSFKTAFLKRKAVLEDQLVKITEQPSIGILELKKALSGLIKLGKGPLAHQLMLRSYGSRLQRSLEAYLPSCSVCPKVFPATIAKLVFSTISLAAKDSGTIFGDNPVFTNRVVQWAEWKIEFYVRLVKENAPPSETISALRAACVCAQASLNYCSMLESQGMKLSKLLLEIDAGLPLSPHFISPLSEISALSDSVLVDSGMRFMHIVEDILDQITPLVVLHYGGNVLTRISHLFDKYMDALNRALPGTSDDDNLTELKEFGVPRMRTKKPGDGNTVPNASTTPELKDWKRHALFAKLQQLAIVAGDVLLGKEKLQKILLARLTETVVMWLSEEEEFWGVFENESSPVQPLGLQQLILDMHFTVEIARYAGYPSRPLVHFPMDEWFVETAKSAIHKLLSGGSGSEVSDIDDEEHIILNEDDVSDSADTVSSVSTVESFESFASASMGELESPHFTDPEA